MMYLFLRTALSFLVSIFRNIAHPDYAFSQTLQTDLCLVANNEHLPEKPFLNFQMKIHAEHIESLSLIHVLK